MQDAKKSPKIAIWAQSHNCIGLYLRNEGTYRQSEKKLVKQQYVLHMSSQYGELRPASGWDRFTSLGHPCKFQWVSRLGSVTARQSSSECHRKFAALNRGRHLCSAGRPSRWALAHISSISYFPKFQEVTWSQQTPMGNISCMPSCTYQMGPKNFKMGQVTITTRIYGYFVMPKVTLSMAYVYKIWIALPDQRYDGGPKIYRQITWLTTTISKG